MALPQTLRLLVNHAFTRVQFTESRLSRNIEHVSCPNVKRLVFASQFSCWQLAD